MKNLLTLFATAIASLFGTAAIKVSEDDKHLVLDESQAKTLLEAAQKVPGLVKELSDLKTAKDAADAAKTASENTLKSTLRSVTEACGLEENDTLENSLKKINEFKSFPGTGGAGVQTEEEKIETEKKAASQKKIDDMPHNKKAEKLTFKL